MADMMFRQVKASLIAELVAAAAGRFTVVKSQKQSINAEKQLQIPRVMVNFANSSYSSDNSSFQVEHDSTLNFVIKISVASPILVDLETLNDELATAGDRATALANAQDICDTANDLINEISDNVYQIIEDARNYDLGFAIGLVRDRHIDNLTIYEAQRDGQLVLASSVFDFSCKVTEIVDGETGTAAAPDAVADGDIHANDEDTNNAGVIV